MSWSATNAARVRLPFSEGTARALHVVRESPAPPILAVSFADPMVRALWRGAKEQTSRLEPIKGWRVGRLVRVREAWRVGPGAVILYRADDVGDWRDEWRPAIYAPRRTARLLLRVTHPPYSKRLGDFDGEDVLREGCPLPSDDPAGGLSFADVWKQIHGTLDEDLLVWVHRFEVLR